jgi:hypothetical protein
MKQVIFTGGAQLTRHGGRSAHGTPGSYPGCPRSWALFPPYRIAPCPATARAVDVADPVRRSRAGLPHLHVQGLQPSPRRRPPRSSTGARKIGLPSPSPTSRQKIWPGSESSHPHSTRDRRDGPVALEVAQLTPYKGRRVKVLARRRRDLLDDLGRTGLIHAHCW